MNIHATVRATTSGTSAHFSPDVTIADESGVSFEFDGEALIVSWPDGTMKAAAQPEIAAYAEAIREAIAAAILGGFAAVGVFDN